MKMKKVILSCLMLIAGLSASAQEEQKGTTEYIFAPHFYIQLQGGARYTTGETDFGKLISPTIQGAIGYQFNKALGARLGVNAWQSKGGYDIEALNVNNKSFPAYKTDYKFTSIAPALDLTLNLSNLFFGVGPKKKVDFGVFIGVGANIRQAASDDVKAVKAELQSKYGYGDNVYAPMPEDFMESGVFVTGRGGVFVDFKITDQFAIGIEANANILSDKFNYKKAGNPDSYFNALLGLKYAFGPTYTTKFIPAPEPQIEYVEKIVEKIVEVPAPTPVIEPIRRDIFFLINKYNIRETEESKVKEIVDYMRQNQTAKVSVTGYADAGTGNDRINDRLAAQRADAVVKMLTEKYGIAADRISYDSKGARVQPFADNDSNRVSICIAEVQE